MAVPLDSLQFKGSDPGAVRLGNFINYYGFHPPENRLRLFPHQLPILDLGNSSIVCLDIGCNSGELTQQVYGWIIKNLEVQGNPLSKCSMIGCDIDPTLIERAQNSNSISSVEYVCMDFMNPKDDDVLQSFLSKHNRKKFDIIFCLSVTMWIHLNHGDDGLRQMLNDMCEKTNVVVIEAQPWKCYRSAVRRLKKCGESFPFYEKLRMKHTVDKDIESILQTECNFTKIYETAETSWGRKIVFYKKNAGSSS